jgi:membrane associated rhomboid family serine protease
VYGRGGHRPSLGFGPAVTPPIVKQLLIANAAVFLGQMLVPSLEAWAAVRPDLFWRGLFLWQPFTYLWLHGSLGHVAMNMFVLWMFGSPLALVWGPRRFLRYYLVCGVGAGLIIASYPWLLVLLGLASPLQLRIPTVGASGAVYGVVLAYSLTWPDRTIMLIFPPVAFRAIWIIPVMFFMTVFLGGANISHIGHLGGVVVGWLALRSRGDARPLPSLEQLKSRWRRYRMRQRLRAVRYQEWEEERRRREENRTYH